MNDTTANATTKRFTLDEASAMLPLVRSIVSDICEVFRSVTSRRVELHRLLRKGNRGAGRIYDDEMAESRADLQAEYDRIWQFREELETLGILLRQPEEGLIEFPTQIDSQLAFYSWRLGEPTICHYRWLVSPAVSGCRSKFLAIRAPAFFWKKSGISNRLNQLYNGSKFLATGQILEPAIGIKRLPPLNVN